MKLKHFIILVSINGQNYQIASFYPLSLFDIIKLFNYNQNIIILEYNGEIYDIEKSRKVFIKMNDFIEILTIVGGG